MTRALFIKAMRDGRLLLLSLAIYLFAFAWLNIWASSMISLPAFSEFLASALPARLERLSGVPFSQVATTAGRAALVYVHALVLFGAAAWSIARGSDCVSGEIGRGTMELLLAEPIGRFTVYATQAAATVLGAALLATAVWCGTAMGLATVELPERVPASVFIPPAVNLFGLMVCLGGMSACVSSWDSQRWRTVGIVAAWYVFSTVLEIVGRMTNGWHWLTWLSLLSGYSPQLMVAQPAEAWSIWIYRDGGIAGLGLGGQQLALVGLGMLCYLAGAVIFSRREIPAPL